MELLQAFERIVGWQFIPILLFFIIATYTDIETKKIRNWTSGGLALYNSIVFVLIPLLSGEYKEAGLSVLGGLLAFVVVLAPAAYFVVSMGGDIKFAGAAGIAIGGLSAVSWVLVSAILMGIYGTYLVKRKGKTSWDTVPFAPFFFTSLMVHVCLYGVMFYS